MVSWASEIEAMTTSRLDSGSYRLAEEPGPPVLESGPSTFPPQHGVWAFLTLPVVLGTAAGGWSWTAVPVLLGWVSLYPFSWALTNRLAAPRPARFNRALQVWAVVTAPLLIASVTLHPWLLWVGSVYAAPFAANVVFASARRERSLANDAFLILECVAAVPVVAGLSSGPGAWTPPWGVMVSSDVAVTSAVCALALVGSTLHVRSLVRERANPRFTVVSRAFAIGCVPLAGAMAAAPTANGWIVVPFALLAARSVLLHDPSWRPSRIGVVELAGLASVAFFATLALT